jgi:hypothetical protein
LLLKQFLESTVQVQYMLLIKTSICCILCDN